MKIENITIKKITPKDGHVGFCSFIVDEWLFLNNIAIFTRLGKDKIRLVFPQKKLNNGSKIDLFYPLDSEKYHMIEDLVDEVFRNKT